VQVTLERKSEVAAHGAKFREANVAELAKAEGEFVVGVRIQNSPEVAAV
jgi:hypothetical protein